MNIKEKLLLAITTIIGVISFAILALSNGETVNAGWIVLTTICVFTIGYRLYSKFIAEKIFELDDTRLTPAQRLNDGLDYVPTNKIVLFGHHFAAIAGAGPLVGPVLAAQMGYLPGTIWILAGVVLAGAVQDFLVLFISTRRDGRSLGEIARMELGNFAGTIVMIGALTVMFIILAALAFVVVNASAHSAWTVFSIAATIPIAIFMGIYMRYIRPGKIAEISVIGFVLMMLAIIYGGDVANTELGHALFYLDKGTLTWWLIGYGFVAAVLPVWLLLAPRDYLSTFLKLGVILGLAVGILVTLPNLQMPAITKFVDGTGPVVPGNLFPFLFITIACGACSGFHALVSSGTTPKLVEKESHTRFLGYGGMLGEALVGIMAITCACILEPGVYFAVNTAPVLIGTTVQSAAEVVSSWGFVITPQDLQHLADAVGEESILSRTGGAPTFALGMAHIIVSIFKSEAMMGFWYHFALLFEALFILTAVDAGTRSCRFAVQDLLGIFVPKAANTHNFVGNILGTVVAVSGWGYFVYQSVHDPLGGISSLWPLFGIGNQLLSGMALILGTVILFKMKKEKYIWVTLIPTGWLLVTSLYAGWEKIFNSSPAIGFLAQAKVKAAEIASGTLAPEQVVSANKVIFNNYVNASLTAFFMAVSVIMLITALGYIKKAYNNPLPSVNESEAIYEK